MSEMHRTCTFKGMERSLKSVPQAFPYQGSKRLLAPVILACLPRNTDRLIEPFAGSAAVSVAAGWMGRARRFILNDAHTPLVRLWQRIIDDPEGLARDYSALWHGQLSDSRRYYDVVRELFNREHRPEHFLYLLARCVKAAIRYNRDGEFNNSPDKRRLGMRPETMRQNLRLVSEILHGRTAVTNTDYVEVLAKARRKDVIYMDPPYQGVCKQRDNRYVRGIIYEEFVSALAALNARGIAYLVSYDGRTGDKTYGQPLPASLELHHAEVAAGRSTQATLLGRAHETFESLYLSPALVERLGEIPTALSAEDDTPLFAHC